MQIPTPSPLTVSPYYTEPQQQAVAQLNRELAGIVGSFKTKDAQVRVVAAAFDACKVDTISPKELAELPNEQESKVAYIIAILGWIERVVKYRAEVLDPHCKALAAKYQDELQVVEQGTRQRFLDEGYKPEALNGLLAANPMVQSAKAMCKDVRSHRNGGWMQDGSKGMQTQSFRRALAQLGPKRWGDFRI